MNKGVAVEQNRLGIAIGTFVVQCCSIHSIFYYYCLVVVGYKILSTTKYKCIKMTGNTSDLLEYFTVAAPNLPLHFRG